MVDVPPVTDVPPPEATPLDLLRSLRGLVESGALRLELDLKRLDHMDSPVGVEADSNRWIYPAIVLCGGLFWFAGLWAGLAAAGASLVLYLTLGRSYVRRRLVRRVHEGALYDLDLWRRLWRYGGVALVPAAGAAAQPCAAPGGNWMALVRALSPAAG
jgi:hypothetical protein